MTVFRENVSFVPLWGGGICVPSRFRIEVLQKYLRELGSKYTLNRLRGEYKPRGLGREVGGIGEVGEG